MKKCNCGVVYDEEKGNFYLNKSGQPLTDCKECIKIKGQEKRRLKREPVVGLIYIISNPAWGGYYKIGRTSTSIANRLTNMNVYAPHKDFVCEYTFNSVDTISDEYKIHEVLGGTFHSGSIKSEWFKLSKGHIIKTIQNIITTPTQKG